MPMMKHDHRADLEHPGEPLVIVHVHRHFLGRRIGQHRFLVGHSHSPLCDVAPTAHNKPGRAAQAPAAAFFEPLKSPLPRARLCGCAKGGKCAKNRTRSLLLLDASADERRLISAIAARAAWSAVGAADEETAVALLQGPHGREVQAALLGSWNAEQGRG